MTIQSKRDYLQAIRIRYRTAPKDTKTTILDEFCTICGYNRKYAISRLKNKNLIKPQNFTEPHGTV
jgi:hypothetical protein